MGHLQARDAIVDYAKMELCNGTDEFVQWAVVQTTMQKFDEQTEEAFDSFRTLPGEDGTDRDQVCTVLVQVVGESVA